VPLKPLGTKQKDPFSGMKTTHSKNKMIESKPIKILLLENQGIVRAGFKAILRESFPAAEVHEAADYAQAIAILVDTSIDFAFLDIHLAD
jgi:PleD family two-component response regulator